MKKKSIITVAALLIVSSASVAFAASPTNNELREQTQTKEQTSTIYGSQLMTPQERLEYRAKLRTAKTMQERERIRMEHHEQMMERARKEGVELPAVPPQGGAGMGPGPVNGGMMGPGAGMGPRGGAR